MKTGKGRVLIVDDEADIRELLIRLFRREGFEPLEAGAGAAALELIKRESVDVVLLDVQLPDMNGLDVLRQAKALDPALPVVMLTGHAFVQGAVEALHAGAHDYLQKPFDHGELVRALHRAMTDRGLRQTIQRLQERVGPRENLRQHLGPSDQALRISQDVARVAPSMFAVLITGETGVGKEVVARAIHEASARAAGPFVAVDCGAVPETLFESEFFGHERGAFTGADHQRHGKFEQAAGGTLFLDEVGNMTLGSQAKLLRVLQEGRLVRVGGAKEVGVDVRVLAAANVDLEAAVATGAFRRDLFFRLNEFAIAIPPLRARPQDILVLAKRFLDVTNQELGKAVAGFTQEAVERLLGHTWPGNVRELRSAIRRAILLADDRVGVEHLELHDAPAPVSAVAVLVGASAGWQPLRVLVQRAVETVERSVLTEVLRSVGGNKARAARVLQIDYKTIHTKLKEYGIGSRRGDPDLDGAGPRQGQAP